MVGEQKFFYTNGMELAVSAYDVTLKFLRNGAMSTVGAEKGVTVEATIEVLDTLVVGMSPSHAKALVPGLMLAITQYEKQHGKIPLPPEAVSAWNTTFPERKIQS